MNPDHWQLIKSIVNTALTLAETDRDHYLSIACKGDETIRREIEELLRSIEDSEKSGFLEKMNIDHNIFNSGISDTWVPYPSHSDLIGKKIGVYKITGMIGSGGMGSVFKAERADGQFRHEAAIKIIRKGLDSKENLRRFRIEQEILARLRHPNIAQLYDGGMLDEGTPYLVMEYVEGIPVDEYCNSHRLSIDLRLDLFRDICLAVQYAHSNLVIHRDLKPQNILVTQNGVVKILDFGIAKLLDPEFSEITLFETHPGHKFWTPQYAAPEQVKGEAITIETDIYALGITLHKLLTDTWPFDLRNKNLQEIEKIIVNNPPVSPLQAIGLIDIKECAYLRKTTPLELRNKISGDLDALVLKTIRKEPRYRYLSAAQLLDELDRYSKGLPLIARKGTLNYRVKKFTGRHRWGVSMAAIIFLALVMGIVGTLWQARVAQQERDLARLEAAKAKATQDYLIGLFEEADPSRARGEPLTVNEIVLRGIDRLDADFERQPEVHIEMLTVLGRIQQMLGDYSNATQLMEEALTKTRELRGSDHPDIASIAALLGDAARWNGELDKAEIFLQEALTIRLQHSRGDNSEIATNMDRLARVLEMRGRLYEAENLYLQALEMRKRMFGDDSDAYSATLSNIGWLYHQMGKKDDAENALRTSLNIRQQILESPHPALASTINNLAVVLRSKANYEEALYYFELALHQERQLHGNEHPRITTALSNLSQIHLDLARYDEAANQYRQILENNRKQLGPQHLYVGFALGHLAYALTENGHFEEAMPLIEEMLDVFRSSIGEQHRFFGRGLMIKGYAYCYQNPEKSVEILEEAANLFRQTSGPEHPDLAEALSRLGWAQIAAGKIIEAEASLRESLEIQQIVHPTPHPDTIWTLTGLGHILKKQGQVNAAEKHLIKAVDMAEEILPSTHWRHLTARLELSDNLLMIGQRDKGYNELENILLTLEEQTDFHSTRLLQQASNIKNIANENF